MSDLFEAVEPTNVDAKYEDLVGEGKKYKTADDLAKAKAEADAFIERLKQEANEMRTQIGKASTLDDIMTKIREANATPPQQQSQQPQAPEKTDLDPAKLEELVSGLFTKKEAENRVKTNRQVVEDTLKEKWGADANLRLNQRAKDLGVDLPYLQKIALESPKAFFELVGLNQKTTVAATPAAPRGQQVESLGGGERKNSFYQNLKRTNPTEYFSAKVQSQMYKDSMAQGEAFFD